MLRQVLAIASGGAVGALLRFWLSTWVDAKAGGGFPYGTLAVNVVGSLVMGLLYVVLVERIGVQSAWQAPLLIGLLGAFTTFSTFSLDTLRLLESGQSTQAGLNMLLSVLLCLGAAFVGLQMGRQI